MKTNIFTTAVALSDSDLLARTVALANTEREATAELVAHLAVLEMRPAAHAALGYGSLFAYCTQALRLSEDAACTRIAAARWCRLFPVIADLMAAGSLSLTAVRLLGPHLRPENHQAVLDRATNRKREDIEALVAELAPQPDLVASVRKLPSPKAATGEAAPAMPSTAPAMLWPTSADTGEPSASATGERSATAAGEPSAAAGAAVVPAVDESLASFPVAAAAVRVRRPIVKASAPKRYRVQFTIGQDAHDKLRRLQTLLRREIPDGDPGLIFERFLDVLLEKVEKAKLGAAGRRPRRVIRPETDNASDRRQADGPTEEVGSAEPVAGKSYVRTAGPSRHIPAAVRSAVWRRDAAQCAFLAPSGTRCTERSYLEFHHVQPFAMQGPATVDNISLRCRRHNQYEAELIFGPRDSSTGLPTPPASS
jgi:hypothetical protein